MPGVIINRLKRNSGLGGTKILKKTMASGASSGVSGGRVFQKRVLGVASDILCHGFNVIVRQKEGRKWRQSAPKP
jgi:hypothetical protein